MFRRKCQASSHVECIQFAEGGRLCTDGNPPLVLPPVEYTKMYGEWVIETWDKTHTLTARWTLRRSMGTSRRITGTGQFFNNQTERDFVILHLGTAPDSQTMFIPKNRIKEMRVRVYEYGHPVSERFAPIVEYKEEARLA